MASLVAAVVAVLMGSGKFVQLMVQMSDKMILNFKLTFINSTILSASRTLTSNLNSPFTKYFTVGYPFTLKREPISASFVASSAASTPGI